jgi:nicotinamide riboside kinase
MLRIGFTGVPGAGKTSTARALAAFCRRNEKLKRVELIAEYARRYLAKYGVIDHLADQYKIMEKQLEWEDQVPKEKTDLIITDSPVHLGWLYVLEYGTSEKKDVMYSNDIFKKLNKSNYPTRYDIVFHLPPVIKPVEDGVRPPEHFDASWRNEADSIIRFIFKQFKPKQFIEITSVDMMDRIDECMKHIDKSLNTDPLKRSLEGE